MRGIRAGLALLFDGIVGMRGVRPGLALLPRAVELCAAPIAENCFGWVFGAAVLAEGLAGLSRAAPLGQPIAAGIAEGGVPGIACSAGRAELLRLAGRLGLHRNGSASGRFLPCLGSLAGRRCVLPGLHRLTGDALPGLGLR